MIAVGLDASAIDVDVDVEAMVRHGRLNILINNAGIAIRRPATGALTRAPDQPGVV